MSGEDNTTSPAESGAVETPEAKSFDAADTGGEGQFRQGGRDDAVMNRSASIQDEHLEAILDVPITLSMEVGRSRISIRDLLQLNPGSVIKLRRAVGDPMDILVNGCLVAKGEVVVVGDQFAIRIADVVSAEERVQTLS